MAVQTALDNHQQTLGYLGNQSRRRADEGWSEVPDQDFYGEVGEAGGAVVWDRGEGRKNWSQKWSHWRKWTKLLQAWLNSKIAELGRMRESWTTYSSTQGGGICEVFKVPEKEKETAADCTAKVCAIFSDKVGIPITASDIEVAHRTWQRSSTRARPILVRFFDRKKRDSVIISRRNLKNKGIVIGKTWHMPITKCSERRVNILLQCRCGVQMEKFLPRWRTVALLERTFTQIWMKHSGVLCREMKWVQMKENRSKLVSCVGACVLAQWKGRGKDVISC